jgi:hypothetical protein
MADGGQSEKARLGSLRLCRRCGDEIALANDLDREPDIDRPRHVVFVAGEPRQLTPHFWRLFALLYSRRGSVVLVSLLRPQRENLCVLRKLLVKSRYQIVNRKSIGYELIVTPEPAGAKLPFVRGMISAALEYAAPEGLLRAEIAAAISRDYGIIKISLNTLTGTLARMHAAGRIRRVGLTWFLM